MDAKTKLEELSLELVVEQNKSKTIEDEKKIDEDNLTSANEELANLTKVMENLESKLQNKYKIKSDLDTKLEEVKIFFSSIVEEVSKRLNDQLLCCFQILIIRDLM